MDTKFKKGMIPWNKNVPTTIHRCSLCGSFISLNKKHICRNVDLKGERFCNICGIKLKNTSWERYSKICGKCGKIKFNKNQKELRKKAILLFGGKCQICGYNKYKECLEFHHLNSSEKKGKSFIKEVLKNPEKFKLYCNRCHREVELKIKRSKIKI